MTQDERADLDLLNVANEKRKFAIQLSPGVLPEALQLAFERGIDQNWFDLVDVTVLPMQTGDLRLMRVFRLTDAGLARHAALARQAL